MTEIAVEALCLAGSGFQADILLGPGFSREEALRIYLQEEAAFPYRMHRSAEAGEIARLMAASDMALASFGMTAYELAAMRVPALYLCLSPLHERRAIGFQKQGLAVNLGLYQKNRRECLAVEIRLILDDAKRRWAMMEAAAQLQVGSGAERIADLLSTEIGRRRRNAGDGSRRQAVFF
jgi:spore coat polysaccharide biosynthesis protein SpsF